MPLRVISHTKVRPHATVPTLPPTPARRRENGERQLNIVELREWISALGGNWVEFVKELEVALAKLEANQTTQPTQTTQTKTTPGTAETEGRSPQ